MDELYEANHKHKKYSNALTKGGRYGDFVVTITVTSDKYGNNQIASRRKSLQGSQEGKEVIAKLRDEAWDEVVRLRAELRGLGVEL